MDDLLSEFLTETAESLAVIDVQLVEFEKNPNDKDILSNIFRLVHTIKGPAGSSVCRAWSRWRTPVKTFSVNSATASLRSLRKR